MTGNPSGRPTLSQEQIAMFDAASEVRKTALRKTHVDIVVGAIGSVRLAHFKIPQQYKKGRPRLRSADRLGDDAIMERLIEIARGK